MIEHRRGRKPGKKTDAKAHEQSRHCWDLNAAFWDEKMGDGNDFVNILEWPAVERLLAIAKNERVLDIACGNGLTSRRLAGLGAQVKAIDFSREMLEHARARRGPQSRKIEYLVLDATDEQALLSLGARSYDAALCNMALFDMSDISPLLRALSKLLKPQGRFVFSILHPCFNHTGMAHVGEREENEGTITTRYSVKIWRYLTPTTTRGIAMEGQPETQMYFERPLHEIFGACFKAGFVIDGLEECAFSAEYKKGSGILHWSGNFSEIPPILVVRARVP